MIYMFYDLSVLWFICFMIYLFYVLSVSWFTDPINATSVITKLKAMNSDCMIVMSYWLAIYNKYNLPSWRCVLSAIL